MNIRKGKRGLEPRLEDGSVNLSEVGFELKKHTLLEFFSEKKFDFLKALLKIKGVEVYAVGGFVRDWFLDIRSKDIDFVVRGLSLEDLGDILKKYGKVKLVGRDFGVLKLSQNLGEGKVEYDIALPRKEFSLGTGERKGFRVKYSSDLPIEEDLKRRDFTINAIAFDISNGRVIDPFSGLRDLNNKIIRAVGDPKERFREDQSRVFRALRFGIRFGFEIEDNTWKNLKEVISSGAPKEKVGEGQFKVPLELISSEFIKSLEIDPRRTLILWSESGAFSLYIPEIEKLKECSHPPEYHSEGDVFEHTKKTCDYLKKLIEKIKEGKFMTELLEEGLVQNGDGEEYRKFLAEWVSHLIRVISNRKRELALAVLFHDIGKPETYQERVAGGRKQITFYEHARKGKEIFDSISKRIKLESVTGLDVELVSWLIEEHMFIHDLQESVKDSRILKRNFLNRETLQFEERGALLWLLSFINSLATIPQGKLADVSKEKILLWRLYRIRREVEQEKRSLKKVITGRDLLRMGFRQGPFLGVVLEMVDELVQNGYLKNREEALSFVKKVRETMSKSSEFLEIFHKLEMGTISVNGFKEKVRELIQKLSITGSSENEKTGNPYS